MHAVFPSHKQANESQLSVFNALWLGYLTDVKIEIFLQY